MKFLLFSLVLILFAIPSASADPAIFDRNFKIEKIAQDADFPIQMDFVGDDMLVLEKGGNVRLIRDGILQEDPVLQIDVVNIGHDGLLGITHVNNTVYLYMTQETDNPDEPLVNRVYKYKWNGEKLIEPMLVNELPANPRHDHAGGVMVTDLDGNVFTIIGDLFREGLLQHFGDDEPDDTSMVLRVGLDENVVRPYLSENPFEHYYGIGIRNSYGLTIDPVTGYLWQTENGPENFDEINLIRPGFDGGWKSIRGPATAEQIENLTKIEGFTYSNPEFSWETVVAPTGLTFVDSEPFSDYHDYLLVADFNTGSIFKFELNDKRDGFVFTNPDLKDLALNPGDSFRELMFGTGFKLITEMEQGPDGFLYLISLESGGIIYRIEPNDAGVMDLSPKKLQESGIPVNQIKCKNGLVLMEKKYNGEAICVFPKSTTKLIEWNWAMTIDNTSNICNTPPSKGVNWTNCNFSFSDLSEISMEGSNLNEANLIGANFKDSSLPNSDFTDSNLGFADFTNADISNSTLFKTKSHHSDYSNAKIINADLSKSEFTYGNLQNADLSNSIMKEVFLTGSDMSFANLTRVDMTNSRLPDAVLHGVDLTSANLSEADLRRVDFSNANLSGANFSNANLLGAKFQNAMLNGADLSEANLEWANFTNADLSEVNLSGTNLKYVSFENATLDKINFEGCKNNLFCDKLIPIIEITNPLSGEISNYTGIIVVEGTAFDESGVDKVDAFAHTLPHDGEFNFEPATPKSPGDWSEWSIELLIPDEQSYRILARVIDVNGNPNWAEIIINEKIDTTVPEISITNPESPDAITNHIGEFTIKGSAFDESGINTVEVFVHTLPLNEDFNFELATPITVGDWSEWSIEITIPDDQQYRVLVRAIDKNGNPNWAETMINKEN